MATTSIATGFVTPASAIGSTGSESDFHSSYDRPGITVVNNSSDSRDVSIVLRTAGGSRLFEERTTLSSVQIGADRSTRDQFRSSFDVPVPSLENAEDEQVMLQAIVDGETRRELPVDFGPDGLGQHENINVDVRDERVKVTYSVM